MYRTWMTMRLLPVTTGTAGTLALVALALAACTDSPVGPPRLDNTPSASSGPLAGGAEVGRLSARPPRGPGARPAGLARQFDTIPGEYIIVLKDDVADAPGLARALMAQHGGALRFTYGAALKGFAGRLPAAAVAALRHNPHVDHIEPDMVVRTSTTQSMDIWGQPWGLDALDQRSHGVNLSWTYTYAATGRGVYAYIVDTGIRARHPEFGTRAQDVYDAFGGTGDDCNGHGTHVAGTVGGITFGVAKQVLLRGVRVLDCNGSGSTSGVIAGIDWVRLHHVNPAIANLSLGGAKSAALNTAVTALVNAGVFVAVAAGNSWSDACYYSPASATAAFTTAAANWFEMQSFYTNYGPCVDAFAPGDDILSASLTLAGGETMTGTSMAAPHVTGLAALILQHFPSYTPAQTTSWILNNATRDSLASVSPGTPNRLIYKGNL